jgi:hypothetical protein
MAAALIIVVGDRTQSSWRAVVGTAAFIPIAELARLARGRMQLGARTATVMWPRFFGR